MTNESEVTATVSSAARDARGTIMLKVTIVRAGLPLAVFDVAAHAGVEELRYSTTLPWREDDGMLPELRRGWLVLMREAVAPVVAAMRR